MAIAALAPLLVASALPAAGPPPAPKPAPSIQDSVVVDEKTDILLKGAMRYLAARQNVNGSWTGSGEAAGHPVAMTGYTLMAFLATGNLPGEGEYGKAVQRGTQYLMDCVDSTGYIHATGGQSNMYAHGIATIALAEIYGQSKDPRLRDKLKMAVQLILSCQNPNNGGWRYPPRVVYDPDLSVSVLQIVALRSAKNAGIDVPQSAMDKSVEFVKSCYDASSGGFTYQPRNRAPGFARTAAGIYCLQVCGLYDDAMVRTGSSFLFKNKHENQYYTYGQFYAAPAQYMIGGDVWKRWYEAQSQLLISKVKQEGDMYYWEPIDGRLGTVYATAVYSTILAMPYHYVPLYQR